ncbi:hypothetical protein ACFOY2_52305 [Nonomuraea purpurea]|uniref:Uncharacterized protein n=1 Tax=Nonomuraea purpurea TaxID=1849276 RepID=A0ABV8GQB2_9ACTN
MCARDNESRATYTQVTPLRTLDLTPQHRPRHDPRDLFGAMIPDAGFEVDSEGDLPYLLYYVRATHPDGLSSR